MGPHKIPTSPALQRLGEEFQAMYGQQIETRSKVDALRQFLAARGFVLGETQRALVEACDDVATVDRWITRAACAATLDEVFAD
jgi:hypothetical protein